MPRVFAAFLALSACSFDPSGTLSASSDDGGTGPDAAPCTEPVRLALSVNGVTAPPAQGEPFVEVLVGDTVELSARGSCVIDGPARYAWQVSPIDGTRDTALPGLDAETIQIYSVVADRQYNVSLTVSDANGRSEQRTEFAFVARGFQPVGNGPGNGDVRDVNFGGGVLWIAAKDGAFAYAPGDATVTFLDLADNWTAVGTEITDDLEAAWYDPDSAFVWFGRRNGHGGVWRGSAAANELRYIAFNGSEALGTTSGVNDIDDAGDGVRIATDDGVTEAPDNQTFVGRIAPPPVKVEALTRASGGDWAGGTALWNLAAAGNGIETFDSDPGTDDKVRGMAGDATGGLWLASDGLGVARINATTGAPIAVYTAANGLSSDNARDLVVELDGPAIGDVWVATKEGVSRFKADRAAWVALGATAGLGMRGDLRAITLDPTTRTLYAGGNKGLVYIRVP